MQRQYRHQIFQKLQDKILLPEKKWNEYIGYFKRIEVPAKAILLREGEVSKKAFLIEQGSVRVWFINNGKDVTFQFFFENDLISSVESFRKKIPSAVTIETIEPGILWWIHKKDLDKIILEINHKPELREKFINAIFERTFNYMKHFLSSIKDSPQQRYLNLIKEKPHIIQRIPQHYIASYLGISTVHLSRIKNKLHRREK